MNSYIRSNVLTIGLIFACGSLTAQIQQPNNSTVYKAEKLLSISANPSIFEMHEKVTEFVKPIINNSDGKQEVKILSFQSDEKTGTQHIRFTQEYKGIPIYGSEAIVHAKNNELGILNGNLVKEIKALNIIPSISAEDALLKASKSISTITVSRDLTNIEKELMADKTKSARLIIYQKQEDGIAPTLAWQITIMPNLLESYECFIDAQTGGLLYRYNKTCAADGPKTATASDINTVNRTINTYQVGSTYYMIDASRSMYNPSSEMPGRPDGVIWTLDALNSAMLSVGQVKTADNISWSAKAVSAQYHAGLIYDYFKNTHNQFSINNQGGNIISVVNVTEPSGQPLDNVLWNGSMILYGNGSTVFRSLAGSLDMAAHEFTHGVIQSNANLEYQGQSGAINESFADIFACMLDRSDWLIGEDVVRSGVFVSGAIRNIQDPHNSTTKGNNGWQPSHMSEYVTGTADNGGVHMNSGILNKAFYLVANSITLSKAEKIYFKALSSYLTRYAQFNDLRFALEQAAAELFGGSAAPEVAAISAAFDAVGIYPLNSGLNYAQDLTPNAGTEKILFYDPNYFNTTRISSCKTDGSTPVPIASVPSICKPSITDLGDFCLYVDTSGYIRKLTLTGTTVESNLFPTRGYFTGVSVSRDGTKLAATSKNNDSLLWVYVFQTNQWHNFKLNHPSYTLGASSPGTYIATNPEWDLNGERVMFTGTYKYGDSSNYTDISIIKVWDNITGGIGSGSIEKIISDNNPNNQLMNPSFSRNSPYIFTYEVYNRLQNNYRIYCRNLITGRTGLITINNIAGNPSYTRLDDKLMYTTYDEQYLDTSIKIISLDQNKIEANGGAITLIPHVKWANWYTQGQRTNISNAKELLQFSLPTLSPPAQGIVLGDSVFVKVSETATLTNLTSTIVTSPFCKVEVGNTTQINGFTTNNFSSPVLLKVTSADNTTRTYTIIAQRPSDRALLKSFSFQTLNPVAFGTFSNDTVTVRVKPGTDITDLIATYSTSAFATAFIGSIKQVSGVTPNDFFDPVTYTIKGYDSTTHNYTVIVKNDVGLKDVEVQQYVSVYPNPTNNLLHCGILDKYSYRILSLDGKIVIESSTDKDEISTVDLTSGIYFIIIQTGDRVMYSRFIKN